MGHTLIFPTECISTYIPSLSSNTYRIPIEAGVHALQLFLHLCNVLLRPDTRIKSSFDGCILGRKPKSIPARGVEDIVALHVPIPCNHIGNGVDSEVTHMKRTGGIRKHGQHI